MTWLLVALNVGVFAWTYPAYQAADQAIESVLDDDDFVATNGLIFASTLTKARKTETPALAELSRRSIEGNDDARLILGHMALRQGPFMLEAQRLSRYQTQSRPNGKATRGPASLRGDSVKIEKWADTMAKLRIIESVHPSFKLGLSYDRYEPWRLITYQIAHSGFLHLFWNMVFLLLFGTFIEQTRGWLAVVLTTWLAGVGGAFAFIGLSGLSASPLVGASAAVSGLIALSASHGKRKVPFVFWLLPLKGYYGVTWLPAWILVPAFILPDLSGWFSSQPGLSAVAYTAHIGGATIGFLMGTYFAERPAAFKEIARGVTGVAASSARFGA